MQITLDIKKAKATQDARGWLTTSLAEMGPVIQFEDLVAQIKNLIIAVRNNDPNTKNLKNALLKLINYTNQFKSKISNRLGVSTKLEIYKKIIEVSMQIRAYLGVPIEQYNNISYAFSTGGKRFFTDQINPQWLRSTSSGDLKINISKAIKELQQQGISLYYQEIQEIIKEHFELYQYAIRHMYKGHRFGKINFNNGHINEGYERHLKEHHSEIYNSFYNQLGNSSKVNVSLLQAFKRSLKIPGSSIERWQQHEDPTAAWWHIRNSTGNQRGTVAGDVGEIQNKYVSGKRSSEELSLVTLTNLQSGMEIYYDILFGSNIDKTAVKVARYISEKVNKNQKYIYGQVFKNPQNNIAVDINNLFRV